VKTEGHDLARFQSSGIVRISGRPTFGTGRDRTAPIPRRRQTELARLITRTHAIHADSPTTRSMWQAARQSGAPDWRLNAWKKRTGPEA
jgi:hypothetical protein